MFISTTVTYNHNFIPSKDQQFELSYKQMDELINKLEIANLELKHDGSLLTLYENHEDTISNKRDEVEEMLRKYLVTKPGWEGL